LTKQQSLGLAYPKNYATPLNFENFHKVEFNLELDETTTIQLDSQHNLFPIRFLILILKKNQNLKMGRSKRKKKQRT